MFLKRWTATFLVGLFLILGCSGGQNPASPPDGWQTTETRWWQEGVDTAEVFRNLDSLSTMGVTEAATMSAGASITEEQFHAAIKRSLLRLYRNNPMVVDSLFEEYAVSELEDVDLSGQVMDEDGELKTKILQKNKKAAYDAITEYFREPQREEGVSDIAYPESLRTEETSGEVDLEAHLNEEGEVIAVKVREGVHPTLDAIAMKSATETMWEPAYLLVDGEWQPRPAWVRFSITYPSPRG